MQRCARTPVACNGRSKNGATRALSTSPASPPHPARAAPSLTLPNEPSPIWRSKQSSPNGMVQALTSTAGSALDPDGPARLGGPPGFPSASPGKVLAPPLLASDATLDSNATTRGSLPVGPGSFNKTVSVGVPLQHSESKTAQRSA